MQESVRTAGNPLRQFNGHSMSHVAAVIPSLAVRPEAYPDHADRTPTFPI